MPDEEFDTLGANILALAYGNCLTLEGNPITSRRLEEAGCQVVTYKGNDISLKAKAAQNV